MNQPVEMMRSLLDPVWFARERLGFKPNAKQAEVLTSQAKRLILNCSRQWGKSTVAAVLGVHRAWHYPRTVVVVASPTLRQSKELVRKMSGFLRMLGVEGRSRWWLDLPNGSRIVGLPGSPDGIRGFSADLVLVDEAARVSDEVFAAVVPMLAATGGDLWLMSTPRGKRGFFYEQWAHSRIGWKRILAPATESPQISPEFLEEARIAFGEARFREEFMCEFLQSRRAMFLESEVEPCLRDDIPVLWKHSAR